MPPCPCAEPGLPVLQDAAAGGASSSQRTLSKRCMFLMRLCKDVRRFDGQSHSQGVSLQQQQAVLHHMFRKRKAGPSTREPVLRTEELAKGQAVPAVGHRQWTGGPEQTAIRQQGQPAMGYRVSATGHPGPPGASTLPGQAAAALQGQAGRDQPVQWQTIQMQGGQADGRRPQGGAEVRGDAPVEASQPPRLQELQSLPQHQQALQACGVPSACMSM